MRKYSEISNNAIHFRVKHHPIYPAKRSRKAYNLIGGQVNMYRSSSTSYFFFNLSLKALPTMKGRTMADDKQTRKGRTNCRGKIGKKTVLYQVTMRGRLNCKEEHCYLCLMLFLILFPSLLLCFLLIIAAVS